MRYTMKIQKLMFIFLALALVLAGCSQINPPEPTPVPTAIPGDSSELSFGGVGVVASGEVVPVRVAHLSFDRAGRVLEVIVGEDEDVDSGQILAQLEGQQTLEAAVIAAELEQLSAQQNLKTLIENADVARALALQAVEDAKDALEAVDDNFAREGAAALLAISVAEEAVQEAKQSLYYFTLPLSQSGLETLEGILVMTEALDQAREAYEPYKFNQVYNEQVDCLNAEVASRIPEICRKETTREQLKEILDNAEGDLNTAVRRLALEVNLVNAEVDLEKAVKDYENLGDGPNEADIALLEAQLAAAQRDYQAYQDGPDPDAVAMAEARLKNAEAQVKVAQNALEGITLAAPITGSVVSVDIIPGDTVLPGQAVITLADLSELRVETTDLSERDVAQVAKGQIVLVYIEALNVDVPGRVVRISPQADVVGGDVVYAVVIELDEQPPGLRWGMSVEVAFEEE
jgi:multidrug efflux pump subunit AcrA (membrane-fusion protein)